MFSQLPCEIRLLLRILMFLYLVCGWQGICLLFVYTDIRNKLIVVVFNEQLWFCLFQKKPRKKKRKSRDSTFFPTQHLGAPGCLDASDDEAKARLSASDLKSEVIKKVHEYKKQDAQISPFSHPGVKVSDVLQ